MMKETVEIEETEGIEEDFSAVKIPYYSSS